MAKLTKRAQILFPRDEYALLEKVAYKKKKSVSSLVREAVEEKYLKKAAQEQHEIVKQLAAMNLPVGEPEEIEKEIILGRLGIKKKP